MLQIYKNHYKNNTKNTIIMDFSVLAAGADYQEQLAIQTSVENELLFGIDDDEIEGMEY